MSSHECGARLHLPPSGSLSLGLLIPKRGWLLQLPNPSLLPSLASIKEIGYGHPGKLAKVHRLAVKRPRPCLYPRPDWHMIGCGSRLLGDCFGRKEEIRWSKRKDGWGRRRLLVSVANGRQREKDRTGIRYPGCIYPPFRGHLERLRQ